MIIKKVFYMSIISLFFGTTLSAQNETFNKSKKDTMAFVQVIQDPEINVLNEFAIKSNKEELTKEGHMIQVYYGKRDVAEAKKEKFEGLYPNIHCEVIYEAPDFKTLVGKYFTKLDADRELEMIRENFKGAFIIKKKIKI